MNSNGMKSRIDLARYFNERKFKVGAEVGVADGRYSQILCNEISGLKLYCVDIWKPYESNWRNMAYQDNAYRQAKEKLREHNVEIMCKPSLDASTSILSNSLDFVFIDGDHSFNYVMLDILLWSPKVRKGGIVAGHDYCHFTNSGVVEAVNKYCEINRIELNLIGRNGNNFKDDRQPTWWFVKK